MNDVRERTEVQQATAPAKRWRNWWRATEVHEDECGHCGDLAVYGPGDLYGAHCRTWPSKDLAETFAEKVNDEEAATVREYLGAFADDERPSGATPK